MTTLYAQRFCLWRTPDGGFVVCRTAPDGPTIFRPAKNGRKRPDVIGRCISGEIRAGGDRGRGAAAVSGQLELQLAVGPARKRAPRDGYTHLVTAPTASAARRQLHSENSAKCLSAQWRSACASKGHVFEYVTC